ncbi:IS66 family insertion sequence element accessory protein TnpB [Singulisphaera sp. GP187]|uniref:IS66 family insertion sequence element accessory protein TnpB n=1 Tax=Singulisphaera sp. GP187 TaxID=1882752 RepID=UPI0009FAFDA0
MRRSFGSLAALVREGLQGDLHAGDLFGFRDKAADRIKLLICKCSVESYPPYRRPRLP